MNDQSLRGGATSGRRKWWPRYSIRTILFGVAIFCVWLGIISYHARRQRNAVDAVQRHNGNNGVCVTYDFQYSEDGGIYYNAAQPGPEWLRNLIGVDYFATVVRVDTNDLGDDVSVLGELPNLSALTIYSDRLSDREIAYLRRSPHIRVLWLFIANPGTSDEGWQSLEDLQSLEELAIGGAGITDSTLRHIDRLASLKSLDIAPMGDPKYLGTPAANSCITNAGLRRIAGLTNLRSLALTGAPLIDDDGLTNLESLDRLERLDLSGAKISDGGLVHLERLTSLRVLNLQYTSISNLGLPHLGGFQYLTGLFLLGTNVTKKGVDQLKRTIPSLKSDL